MPIIFSISRKESGEVIHPIISATRMVALLRDGSKEKLSHPGEEFRVDELEREGILRKVVMEKLAYDTAEDKFEFCDLNEKMPDGFIDIDQAVGYKVEFAGMS